jgi:hypothetical protein
MDEQTAERVQEELGEGGKVAEWDEMMDGDASDELL